MVAYHSSDICLNQGSLVGGIRTVGGCARVERTVYNTLKGGGTKKRGGETKILKRGQAGPRGGCLERRDGNPLQNMCLITNEHILFRTKYFF